MRRISVPVIGVLLWFVFGATGTALAEDVSISATAELGFVRPLYHTIQIGRDTYSFDYVGEGGQEILQPWARFEVDALFSQRHEVSFLYQPLTFNTGTRVDNPDGITIDDVTFADNTPLDLQYGFDFYRLTWRNRFHQSEAWQLALGAGLQLRNASIVFDGFTLEGSQLLERRVISQDLGPVPVISFAARRRGEAGVFFEATLDGFYAPIRYLNLRDVDVIGWLYDAALRVGYERRGGPDPYLSLRVLGGGADGTGSERSVWTQSRKEPRYTANNLNLVVLSLGARI